MLNIKRKILVTTWIKDSADPDSIVRTYGKVNPVKMLRNGYTLVSQDLKEFVLSEEEFALTAKAKEGEK